MKKRLLYLLLAICFVLQTQVVFASSVTMYSADGRELIVAESEVEAQKTVGWFTAPPVLMYSADGRQLLVSGDEIELYQNVGWYLEPMSTMYAPFDRTIAVPTWQVQDYVNVGWFTTHDEALYNEIIPQIQYALSVTDYNGAIDICDDALDKFWDYENVFFEDIVNTVYVVMDTWRATVKQPVAAISSYVTDSYGIKQANIVLRNISYKEISAIELEFNCYNTFNEPVKYYGFGSRQFDGYAQQMSFGTLDTQSWHWSLYGYSETDRIKNIKITRVAFADGTVWTR